MRRNNGHEVWTWDMETFESRLFLMRELFNRVLEHGPQSIPREEVRCMLHDHIGTIA
jgi:hypothetical protein